MNRILVVEDEELIRTMIEMNLKSQNFQVRSCESAEDMMEILEAETFDLILLDIFLPGMHGDEALREIRKKSIRTPVIMVTAKNTLPTKLDSFHHGADDYISKPFDVQELQARVKAVIRRHNPEYAAKN